MTDDPFANDPWGDQLVSEPPHNPDDSTDGSDDQNQKGAPTLTISTPDIDDAAREVSVTLKAGAGYDAPWIVFRASSAGELASMMRSAFSNDQLHEVVLKAAQLFRMPQPAPQATPPQPQPQQSHGGWQSAPQAAPPGMDAPTCPHGTRIYKSGTSARGNWSGWFCPAGRESGCKPIWNNNK